MSKLDELKSGAYKFKKGNQHVMEGTHSLWIETQGRNIFMWRPKIEVYILVAGKLHSFPGNTYRSQKDFYYDWEKVDTDTTSLQIVQAMLGMG
jgi:hypothetical protein